MDESRLYLAPCDNPALTRYFKQTVLEGVPKSKHPESISQTADEILHLWGIPEQKGNRYSNMDDGDFVVFYTGDRTYQYAAKIEKLEQNPILTESIQAKFERNDINTKPLERWDFCIYLQPPFEVDIDSGRLHDYAGHTVNKPFNFQQLNKQATEAIREEFGSITEYLDSNREEGTSNPTDQFESPHEVINYLSKEIGSTTKKFSKDVRKLYKREIPLSTMQQVLEEKYNSDESDSILSVDSVGVVRAARLFDAEYEKISDLAETPVSELSTVTEISRKAARVITDHAKELCSGENTAEEIAAKSSDSVEEIKKTLSVVGATGVPRSEAKSIVTDLHTVSPLFDIDGLQRRPAYHLIDQGYKTPEDIAAADAEQLTEVPQVGNGNVEMIQQNAAEYAKTSGTSETEQPGKNDTDVDEQDTNSPSETDAQITKFEKISGMDPEKIRESIKRLELTGCSSKAAIEWYRRYLLDLLHGDGLFALSGVDPLSGRELIESGITNVEDMKTVDSAVLASKTHLTRDQINSLKQAAQNEKLESMEPVNSELADDLINNYPRPNNAEQRITRAEAIDLLKQSVGHQADFRPQQWEAIDKLANNRDQLLLVQRTGWGKSTVYFIATKAIRESGGGPTLIISPLLSLMRDQIKNAEEQLGLSAVTINSKNEGDWESIYSDIRSGKCDLVLISPERLGNREFREQVLSEMDDGFGMLVVDEAHCISDWGHDFRPDYQRVTRILDRLPKNVPVAATTATANDRVADDITTQLPSLEPVRGDLVRESLRIQAINMGERQKRLAWLAENLPEGERAGIIYCLTVDDVQRVADWLPKHGFNVESYYGGLDTKIRQKREQLLLDNEVDALVATNALGMGFDKPDLKYVIHFQRPQNLIRYYQEIGRAGRDLDTADAVVLSGTDDDETAEYFIESSFPNASNFEAVLETIKTADEPLSVWDLRKESDASQVNRCVQMLEVDGAIEKIEGGYVRTANQWNYDSKKFRRITDQRYAELERIQEFMETDRCLTLFTDEQLDGQLSEPCGQCANCTDDFYPRTVSNDALIEEAVQHYQNSGIQQISNRVYRYLEDGSRTKIPSEHQLETGYCLSVYEEPGWGTEVKEGKYDTGKFADSLVTGAASLIEDDWAFSPAPQWITYIPSGSNEGLIADYANRLGDELGIDVVDCIRKVRQTEPQKELSGSVEKCSNVTDAFEITDAVRSESVLLIDDIVASRWTLTEVGRQLSKAGSGTVYPFVLAKRRG